MSIIEKRIVIVGAGAVGAITAAFLKKAGHNVELVCKYDEYVTLASEHGIKVGGVSGNFTQAVPSVASVEMLKGKADYILLAVKANNLVDAAERIRPFLGENTIVVSMQNGICEYQLQKIIGAGRVAGCIVGWGATMHRQGEVSMTSEGEFILGYPDRDPDIRIKELAEILGSVVPVRVSSRMMNELYSKLIVNACITSLGAITGLLLGEMLARKKARILFLEIIKEAMEVAYIMKIDVPPYGGKLDYYKLVSYTGFWGKVKQHLTLRAIGMKYRKLKSSSLQSLERGKLTEIDYLNGFIASNGVQFGVPVYVNRAIVEMVHEIEQGRREISLTNLDDEQFAKYYRK